MAGFFIVLGDKKDDNGRVIESAMSILDELCTYGYYSTNLHINNGTQIWAKTKVSTPKYKICTLKYKHIYFPKINMS